MFGIGLPELIVILAVALVVVGPDKLPELAKSIAKGIVELKKAGATLKESLREEVEEKGEGESPALDYDAIKKAYADLPPAASAGEEGDGGEETPAAADGGETVAAGPEDPRQAAS